MTMPTQKVEIGFDLTDTGTGPYFRLDDPIAGVLDNTEFLLGGTLFFDVTSLVTSIGVRHRQKLQSLPRSSTVAL